MTELEESRIRDARWLRAPVVRQSLQSNQRFGPVRAGRRAVGAGGFRTRFETVLPHCNGKGAYRNRTGVNGFAGRCVATPPRRRAFSVFGFTEPNLRGAHSAILEPKQAFAHQILPFECYAVAGSVPRPCRPLPARLRQSDSPAWDRPLPVFAHYERAFVSAQLPLLVRREHPHDHGGDDRNRQDPANHRRFESLSPMNLSGFSEHSATQPHP
jgi:hypothetical protein